MDAKFLSSIRVLRLFRLVRAVRTLRTFQRLWLLCSAMEDAMKTMVWVFACLWLFIYVMAVIFTMVIGHDETTNYDFQKSWPVDGSYGATSFYWSKEEYFAHVSASMLTCFQIVTFDHWSTRIVRPITEERSG